MLNCMIQLRLRRNFAIYPTDLAEDGNLVKTTRGIHIRAVGSLSDSVETIVGAP